MNNKNNIIIGQRINTILAEKNIKQKDLASVIGVTDNTISYFVSGKRTPNTEQIIKIAKFLDVSSDYLLGLAKYPTVKPNIQMIEKYTGLSEKAVSELHNSLNDTKNIRKMPYLNSFIENDRTIGFFELFSQYVNSENCLLIKNIDELFDNGKIDESIFDNFEDNQNFTNLFGVAYKNTKTIVVSGAIDKIKNLLKMEIQDRLEIHKERILKAKRGNTNADD